MYDVIVVGAGPAGSTAAKVLADKGLHILLVERHKLPRYKSCSGVLIQKTISAPSRCFCIKNSASELISSFALNGIPRRRRSLRKFTLDILHFSDYNQFY